MFDGPHPTRRAATALRGPVALVTCHPGITADAFEAIVADAPGVVVEGFGDLNVPHALWGPIHATATRGALVVLASAVFTTNTGDDLRALGAIGAGGLTAQKARLAAMAALGSTATRDEAVEFLHQYALAFDAGDRRTSHDSPDDIAADLQRLVDAEAAATGGAAALLRVEVPEHGFVWRGAAGGISRVAPPPHRPRPTGSPASPRPSPLP